MQHIAERGCIVTDLAWCHTPPVSSEGTARIRNAQDLLVFMESEYPGSREATLSRLRPDLREAMETASRTSWIPLEEDAQFVDAVVDYFGPEPAEDMWLDYSSRFVKTPLQRALFDGAIRIFRLSVGTFVRIIPRVWSTSYRGAGTVDVSEKGDNWQRLRIADMHPAMTARDGYAILLRGMFRGMYRLAKDDNEDFDMSFDPTQGVLQAEFRWGQEVEATASEPLRQPSTTQ